MKEKLIDNIKKTFNINKIDESHLKGVISIIELEENIYIYYHATFRRNFKGNDFFTPINTHWVTVSDKLKEYIVVFLKKSTNKKINETSIYQN